VNPTMPHKGVHLYHFLKISFAILTNRLAAGLWLRTTKA
jgi:hypothetical protein